MAAKLTMRRKERWIHLRGATLNCQAEMFFTDLLFGGTSRCGRGVVAGGRSWISSKHRAHETDGRQAISGVAEECLHGRTFTGGTRYRPPFSRQAAAISAALSAAR